MNCGAKANDAASMERKPYAPPKLVKREQLARVAATDNVTGDKIK